jgi:hypothetical protein
LAGLIPDRSAQVGDIIVATVGHYEYTYYLYVEEFKTRPLSLDEMVDGLLFIKARNKIKELYSERRS